MAGRYLVTGAQLGMIAGMAKVKNTDKILEIIEDIIHHQYIDNSTNDVLGDIIKIQESNVLDKEENGDTT